MHVLRSDCTRDFVFMVNFMHIWVNPWFVQDPMEDVEPKVFKDHAEVNLESELIAGWHTIWTYVHSSINGVNQINHECKRPHDHIVDQVDPYRFLQIDYPVFMLHRLPGPRLIKYFVALKAVPFEMVNVSKEKMH